MIQIVISEEVKWVPVELTKKKGGLTEFKIVRERKLTGRKKFNGYAHSDYKEWGSLGGRPPKWNSEAERKKAYRLRKKREKLGEEIELRGYRKKEI